MTEDTIDICELDARRLWTGAHRVVSVYDGAPMGWTFAVPPEVPEGKVAQLIAPGAWLITDPPEPPAPVVPTNVTRRQFKLALYEAGLLADAEKLVAEHPYPPVKIEWDNALDFDRSHPTLLAMATEWDKTDEQIDALFMLAGTK